MTQNRRRLVLLGAMIAFITATITLMTSIQQRNYELRGYVDPTTSADLPFRPINRLGANVDLTQYTAEELQAQLDLMQQANIVWVRHHFDLSDGIHSDWDQVVDAVAEYPDIDLIAVLIGLPPDDVASIENTIADFTARYAPTIDHYQIGDQPNIQHGWVDRQPDAEQYVQVLRVAYDTIHALDPEAVIIAAELAAVPQSADEQLSDVAFLADLYRFGLTEISDAVATQAYGFAIGPYDRQVDADILNFSRIIALREVMTSNSDDSTPLWLTSWGWTTTETAEWHSVDELTQLAYTQQAYQRAEAEWPWLGGMMLHQWQPSAPVDDPLWGYAVLDANNLPTALWDLLTTLSPADAATNGLYAPQNPYASYSGIWTFSDQGADMGWVNDSQVTFEFEGGDVALLLRQGEYIAHLYPDIANSRVNALPRDTTGQAYIALRSDDQTAKIGVVAIAHDLDNTTHELTITADELIPDEVDARWPVVGFAVSSGDLAVPYDRQITVAGFAVIVTGLVVLITLTGFVWSAVVSSQHASARLLIIPANLLVGGMTLAVMPLGLLLTVGNRLPVLLKCDQIAIPIVLIVTTLIYADQTGVIVTLMSIGLLGVVVFNRLELGLMMTLFWAPFFLFPVTAFGFAFPMAEIIILVTAGAWVPRLVINRDPVWRSTFDQVPSLSVRIHVLDLLMLLWVVIGFISLLWTERLDIATTELRVLLIEPALFYLILRTLHPDWRTLSRLIGALLVTGLVVAGIGIVMWLRGESIIEAEEGARRLASVYGSPNNAALLLGRCLPFLIVAVLIVKDSRHQAILAIALLIIGSALMLTQSAGALFIGVPVSVAVILILIYQHRAVLPLAGLTVVIMVGLLIATQVPRFERLTDFSQGTNFYRLRVWDSAWHMIADEPITGIGLDQFLYEFRDVYMLPDAWEEPDLSHPHNILLDQWTRLGLVGVLMLLGMQIVFWCNVMRQYRTTSIDDMPILVKIVVIGTIGSMANLITHGLVDNSIYVIDLAYIHALLLIVSIVKIETNRRPIDASTETVV